MNEWAQQMSEFTKVLQLVNKKSVQSTFYAVIYYIYKEE